MNAVVVHVQPAPPAVAMSTAGVPEASRRGRKPDPNALRFRTIGLTQAQWEYLRQWQLENGAEGDNFTPALGRLVEFAQSFAPKGETVGKPRDARGRFLPGGGTSKSAIYRRRKRERDA